MHFETHNWAIEANLYIGRIDSTLGFFHSRIKTKCLIHKKYIIIDCLWNSYNWNFQFPLTTLQAEKKKTKTKIMNEITFCRTRDICLRVDDSLEIWNSSWNLTKVMRRIEYSLVSGLCEKSHPPPTGILCAQVTSMDERNTLLFYFTHTHSLDIK